MKRQRGGGMTRGNFIAIAIAVLGASLLPWLAPAHGQTPDSDGPPWCGTAWACDTIGLTGKPAQGKFAGIAIGDVDRIGVATGQASADAAEKFARSKCPADSAGQSCSFFKTITGCLGLAGSPTGEVYSWDDSNAPRVEVWLEALKACGAAGCRMAMTACVGDDPRTLPPFPMPPDVTGGKVDPAAVGAWEFPMNPGRWVWEIAANGTYEFHTEAPDGAPSHAGTFAADGGSWTLVSIAGYADTDGGTYLMQGPDTMVMTGKLGKGSWHRIAGTMPVPVKR